MVLILIIIVLIILIAHKLYYMYYAYDSNVAPSSEDINAHAQLILT